MKFNYKNILITGGCGFVGSNLAVSLKQKYPSIKIIALDNLKRRGSEFNIRRLKEKGIEFVHGDIRNPEDLDLGLEINLLIECSAEPLVLSGFNESPRYIINTNLIGSVNCFELARKHKADIIFFSTSRVYPHNLINNLKIDEEETRFKWRNGQNFKGWSQEGVDVDFPLEGARSMYGATKLCSELILQEYMDMYGVRAVINRCGVIAGPWQFGKVDQGVFTLWMLAHYFKKPLSYIGYGGKGKQVRDLLHIDDLFDLIDLQINSMDKVSGKIYNAGGGKQMSLSLLETTKLCQKVGGNKIDITSVKKTRPADLAIYITDNQKVNSELGWKPKKIPQNILEDTYEWIRNNEAKLTQIF
ncbi:MAG: NAD-dependent epimerase/dehydratase family protein [Candidatus Omnitrophota bacterium]